MVFNLLSLLFIGYVIFETYNSYKNNKSLLKDVYFRNLKDYLISTSILFLVLIIAIFINLFTLPKFLTWSWLSLFSQKTTNIITSQFFSGNIILIILLWMILFFCIPFLAKQEEEIFRSLKLTKKSRLISSVQFGLIHITVGVPLIACILLSFVGYLFSIFYIKEFRRLIMNYDAEISDRQAVLKSTSIHAKYNLIICTILCLLGIYISL